MILVDTPVWIDHLRKGVPALSESLREGQVLMHPFVLGEIACGHLGNRQAILRDMAALPAAPTASDSEVLHFIERRSLMGKGIGYIDAHLLASAVLAGTARLWTRDRRLAAVAEQWG